MQGTNLISEAIGATNPMGQLAAEVAFRGFND